MFAVSANVCECLDGTPASGVMCVADGDKTCAECNTGWRLNVNNTGCIRTFADGLVFDYARHELLHFLLAARALVDVYSFMCIVLYVDILF